MECWYGYGFITRSILEKGTQYCLLTVMYLQACVGVIRLEWSRESVGRGPPGAWLVNVIHVVVPQIEEPSER